MRARGLKDMPALSPLARKLLNYETLSELDLFRIIESDPAMTAKVVGLSNSLLFRVGGPAYTTLREGLLRIGYDQAHNIALSFALMGQMTAQRCARFDASIEWRHAMTVAFCARQLNVCLGYHKFDPGSAFIAGLVHNLGLLALASLAPTMFDDLVDAVQQSTPGSEAEAQETLTRLETQIIGLSLASLGEAVAQFWGLPEDTVATIRWHRDPFSAPPHIRDLTVAINTLDSLSRSSGAPSLVALSGPALQLPARNFEYLGIDAEHAPDMLATMKDKAVWVEDLLRLGSKGR
jgi:HD-like signal output (HDOD) protein